MPERPYHSEDELPAQGGGVLQGARRARRRSFVDKYDAMLIVGGSGPIVDLVNNQRAARPDPGVLRRGQADRRRVLRRHLPRVRARTGRTARASSRASTSRATASSTTTSTAPASWARTSSWARRRIRSSGSCATRPLRAARYHGNYGHETSVIVDYPFVTGRSTPDSYLTGPEDGRGARERPRQWGFHPSAVGAAT